MCNDGEKATGEKVEENVVKTVEGSDKQAQVDGDHKLRAHGDHLHGRNVGEPGK